MAGRRIGLVLAAAAALAACGGGDSNDSEGTAYTTDLRPLNGSGVEGTARIVDQDGELEVEIEANGLAANRIHPQHVHGFEDGSAARCPDGEDDGLLTAGEGEDGYGPVVVELAPFPTVGKDGRLRYRVPIPLRERQVEDLDQRAVVLHGLRRGEGGDGRYRTDVPVACGRLQRAGGG